MVNQRIEIVTMNGSHYKYEGYPYYDKTSYGVEIVFEDNKTIIFPWHGITAIFTNIGE